MRRKYFPRSELKQHTFLISTCTFKRLHTEWFVIIFSCFHGKFVSYQLNVFHSLLQHVYFHVFWKHYTTCTIFLSHLLRLCLSSSNSVKQTETSPLCRRCHRAALSLTNKKIIYTCVPRGEINMKQIQSVWNFLII